MDFVKSSQFLKAEALAELYYSKRMNETNLEKCYWGKQTLALETFYEKKSKESSTIKIQRNVPH